MIAKLSHRARVMLRQFLAMWTKAAQRSRPVPKAVAEAMEAERDARVRNACRAIGKARQRKRQVRHEGLRREVANRQPVGV